MILHFGRRVTEVPFSGSDIAVRFLLSVIFNNADSKKTYYNNQTYYYIVRHKKHTKMCFAITFVKLDGF